MDDEKLQHGNDRGHIQTLLYRLLLPFGMDLLHNYEISLWISVVGNMLMAELLILRKKQDVLKNISNINQSIMKRIIYTAVALIICASVFGIADYFSAKKKGQLVNYTDDVQTTEAIIPEKANRNYCF